MEPASTEVHLDTDSLTDAAFARELITVLLDGHPDGLDEAAIARAWNEWCELVTGAALVQLVRDGQIAIGCDESGRLRFRYDGDPAMGEQTGARGEDAR